MKSKMKAVGAGLLIAVMLFGCAGEIPKAVESPSISASEQPVIVSVEQVITFSPTPTAVPTPTPLIEHQEPASAPMPVNFEIPAYYSFLGKTEDGIVLYAFTNVVGTVEYRTVGVSRTLTDGVVTEEAFAWFASDASGNLLSDTPVSMDEESPGICDPISTDGLRLKKKYATADAVGALYSVTDETAWFVYGIVGNAAPAFYPALPSGEMISGALALSEDQFVVSAYAPQSSPKADGDRYITIYIGSQSVAVFIAEDGDWILEHVFLCSTGKKKDYTPRGTFSIQKQYRNPKMGEMNGAPVYSQFASRVTGPYLMHSVPIAGEHRDYLPNGKRQMMVEEYEKLGSPASHGCIRMLVGDSCWIYENCKPGTKVRITDDVGPEPPARPALIYEEPYMDPSQTYGWDPTDPDPENPYLQIESYAAAMIVPTLSPEQNSTPKPTKQATPKPTPAPTPSTDA